MRRQDLLIGLTLGLATNAFVGALSAAIDRPLSVILLAFTAMATMVWAMDIYRAGTPAELDRRFVYGLLFVMGALPLVVGVALELKPELLPQACSLCIGVWSTVPLALIVAGFATWLFIGVLGLSRSVVGRP